MSPRERVAYIDQLCAEMKDQVYNPRPWQPSETHPIRVVHERRQHELKLASMATTVKLNGGTGRPGVFRNDE